MWISNFWLIIGYWEKTLIKETIQINFYFALKSYNVPDMLRENVIFPTKTLISAVKSLGKKVMLVHVFVLLTKGIFNVTQQEQTNL